MVFAISQPEELEINEVLFRMVLLAWLVRSTTSYGAAEQCGHPIVVPALAAQLGRGSAEHRNSLLVALASFGAHGAPALVAALGSSDRTSARHHAADILAYLGSPDADRATNALEGAVSDPDGRVRVAALNALGQLAVPAARRVVETCTRSSDHRLQVLARRLLERPPDTTGEGRSAAVRPYTRDELPEVATQDWPAPDLSLVTCEGGALRERLHPMLARQVEVCRPRYLSRADVPDEVRRDVHDRAAARARTDPQRSDPVVARIAAGAVEQFVHEHVFLEQASVAEPGATIDGLLYGTGVHITDFATRK